MRGCLFDYWKISFLISKDVKKITKQTEIVAHYSENRYNEYNKNESFIR